MSLLSFVTFTSIFLFYFFILLTSHTHLYFPYPPLLSLFDLCPIYIHSSLSPISPSLIPITFPLQLKYKRRVYKMLHLEEKALRALHTRANLRRFLEYVKENNVDKVGKMCAKGLDPNFHCQETGGKTWQGGRRRVVLGFVSCAGVCVCLCVCV